MIKDYFKLAIKNIRKRKLRSWLTLIGIFISIAIIFIIVSLSLGLQVAIQEQFQQLGADKFFIQPLGNFGPGTGGAVTITTGDVDAIKKVNGVKQVTYITAGNAKIESNNQIRYVPVYGIPKDGTELFIESGSMKFEEGKINDAIGEIILGYNFKTTSIFDKPLRAGSKILINDKEFRVSGIFQPVGNPQDDKNVLMRIEDFRDLFNTTDKVDMIYIQIKQGEDLRTIADSVQSKLLRYRGLTEKTKDFSILTPEELLNSVKTILNIITFFLVGVAAISLIVGSVGIANTMYTSVLERTKEIGIMKAIGARNSDILTIFLIESGMIGATGGIMGVLIGLAIAKTVEFIAVTQIHTTLLRAATPVYLIVGCIAFAFIIGAISGIFPARNASKIKTVDALRYE